ncbi:hypothetical protein HNY73_010880 [Argiope bruennichi]|uniref:Uncharacterized protein n=1 Tax=Argiope bruennichi TaxID=94029 RepID=A0A8T0F4E5_ARGBR|nr:hypothetical protein HNY73_010880 [Argiope bruennichi]
MISFNHVILHEHSENKHVSENSDQQNITPEKHSPIPAHSFNLRARGVIEENLGDETSNSMATSADSEDSDKIRKPIHKSVTKQKQEQIYTNNIVKSVSKLKLKKTTKKQSSKNNDEVSITSSETSFSDSVRNLTFRSKKFPENTNESLIKGTDTVIRLDVNSKKIYRKKSNDIKSKASTKNLISESEQCSTCNGMGSFALETSSIDFSKSSLSQTKVFATDFDEPLIKDTLTVTTLNVKSKKICGEKSYQKEVRVSAKKSLIVDSEEVSKNNETDSITPLRFHHFILPKIHHLKANS